MMQHNCKAISPFVRNSVNWKIELPRCELFHILSSQSSFFRFSHNQAEELSSYIPCELFHQAGALC